MVVVANVVIVLGVVFVGIKKSDWQIGKTMVFMKPQGMKDMAKRQREQMAAWEPLISVLEAMVSKKFLEEELSKLVPGLIRFQAHARRYGVQCDNSSSFVCVDISAYSCHCIILANEPVVAKFEILQ